jgi:hypothetical protein
MHLLTKRKLLPPKLRAKSYSNIPKSLREKNNDDTEDENSMFINSRPRMNMGNLVE